MSQYPSPKPEERLENRERPRGVLEVMVPVDVAQVAISENLRAIAALIIGVTFVGLLLIFGVLKKIRK